MITAAVWACTPADAYDKELHLTFTVVLAELAGFSEMEAIEIANFDQGTDEDPGTQPFKDSEARRLYHFVDSTRLEGMRRDALSCKSGKLTQSQFRQIGQYLHALEDFHAHRGFGHRFGHLLEGHAPDRPWHDPGQFVSMVEAKFDALVRLMTRCSSASKTAEQARWDFSKVRGRLELWVEQESQAGVRGDEQSPSRWRLVVDSACAQNCRSRIERSHDEWVLKRRGERWRTP